MAKPTKNSRKRAQKERKKAFDALWRLGGTGWDCAITQDDETRNYKVHLIPARIGAERSQTTGYHVVKVLTACNQSSRVIARDVDPFNAQESDVGRSHGIGGLCKQCIATLMTGSAKAL